MKYAMMNCKGNTNQKYTIVYLLVYIIVASSSMAFLQPNNQHYNCCYRWVDCRLYDSSPLQQQINTESQEEMNILDIMEYLEQTYPQRTGSIVDTHNNKQQTIKIWKKTRNYLYQYRASLSSSITTKSKRLRRDPLTLTNIQQIISFLQTTFPHNPDLQAKIIQESPRILGQYKNIQSRLIPTVDFLKGLYDNMASSDGLFIEAISRNTNLLLIQGVGYTTTTATATNDDASGENNNMIKVEEYLQQELDMKSSAVDKLKQNHPRIFQLSLVEKVQPVVNFLYTTLAAEEHDNISTASQSKLKKQIAKIIINQPMLLQLDVSTNLEPTVNYLRSACDLTEKELSTIILAAPSLLGFSIDDNLMPTLQFLQDTMTDSMKQSKDDGSSDEEVSEESSKMLLRKCILKHPSVLALSIDNLHAKRDYFNSIGIEKRQSLAKRILTSAPSVYSLSLENNIIPKIEYLATLWGDNGSSQNDNEGSFLLDNIYEYPHVLTLSMEDNINPTISFYNMTGYVKEGNNIRGRYIATVSTSTNPQMLCILILL